MEVLYGRIPSFFLRSFLLKMPPKKVTAVSGNGGMKKKKISGKRKERDFSSDDEFDFEQENNKKPGKPCAKSALQPVTVAEDIKEKIVGLLVAYRRSYLQG